MQNQQTKIFSKRKLATIILAVVVFTSLVAVPLTYVLATSPWTPASINVSLDDLQSTANFVVKTDNTNYWMVAQNGTVPFYSTDSSKVITYAMGNTTTGGSVYVTSGTYSATIQVPNGVRLIIEKGATGIVYSIASGATCLITDYNAGISYSYVSGVLVNSYSISTGVIWTSGNVTAYNVESTQPQSSYSYMIYVDPANPLLYHAKAANGTIAFTSTNAATIFLSTCTVGSSVVVNSGSYGNQLVAVPNNCTLIINPGATNITCLVGFTANVYDYQKNVFYREGTNVLAPSYGNGKQVFTWNSCDPIYINSTMLSFLKGQYITDVVLTTQNLTVATMQGEAFKYMQWGYPVWWAVSVWQDSNYLTYTEAQWATKFSQWLAQAPNGRLYLDDMQILLTSERCNAFLNAVRTVQTFNSQNESNIIVDSYQPQIDLITGQNRANIDYDIYTNLNNTYVETPTSTGAKSVGAYIWGFTPFFKYDRNLFNHITNQYAQIIALDYPRLTLWAGFWQEDYHWQCYDEVTDQPVVKAESQLYCNPALWSFIAQETALYLGLQTTGWRGSNLQEGLQLYLPLDDAVSGSANGQYAIDWSGNRRNSNITGGTWTWNAAYGKALYVDGAGTPIDNIATSNMQINKNSQLSVSMWIYPISNTTSQTLVGQTNGGNGWLLNLYNGGLRFFSDTAVTMYDITFTQDIQAEKWTFIAMTWNDYTGTVLFYVYSADGTTSEWTTLSIAPHQIRTDLDRTVFGNYQGSLFGYNGIYDEIRFWNIALTSRDICNIYNQGPLIHGVSGAP